MEFNALIPEFSVVSVEKSISFYCDLLGFEVAYQREDEGFAFLQLGKAQLMVDQIDRGRTFELDGASPVFPFGRGLNVQIEVPSVHVILDTLRQNSIDLYLPLEEKWYRKGEYELGNRQFVVMDPDGYLLRLFENLGQRPFKD